MTRILGFQDFIIESKSTGKIISKDDLHNYDITDGIKKMMMNWDIIYKSPYSNSFYSSTDIFWGSKPDGSYRVSDHWNFSTRGKKHCLTKQKCPITSHLSIGKYDGKSKKYDILLSEPTKAYVEHIKGLSDRKDKLTDPVLIEIKKKFKKSILHGDVYVTIEFRNNSIISGLVTKYTGPSIKVIEPSTGEVLFLDNNFHSQSGKIKSFRLHYKGGKSIPDLFLD